MKRKTPCELFGPDSQLYPAGTFIVLLAEIVDADCMHFGSEDECLKELLARVRQLSREAAQLTQIKNVLAGSNYIP